MNDHPNLAVLRRFATPSLATAWLTAPEEDNDRPAATIAAEDNGAGNPSLLYHTPAGTQRLNSGRDPRGEAERQVALWSEKTALSPHALVVMIGCSGPAHLEALLRRLSEFGAIFVIEPNPDVFRTVWKHGDFTSLLRYPAGMLTFWTGSDPAPALTELKAQLRRHCSGQTAIFSPPGMARCFRDTYADLRQRVEATFGLERCNRRTETIFATGWFRNAVTNLPLLAAAPGVNQLRGRFSGGTAVVVAAGPGLNAMLPWIKSIVGRYPIITVGTALRSLVRAEIEPDFVVAVDGSPEIIPQFQNVTAPHARLVGAFTLHPAVFAFFPQRSFLFTPDLLPGFNYWLGQLGLRPERLRIGGTVSLSAIDLALFLGCRQLVLAGLDLAFGPDGATHAAGTIYEQARITSGAWVKVPDNRGHDVPTSRQFLGYRNIIGDYLTAQTVRNPDLQCYNTSPNGARIAGTIFVAPEQLPELDLPVTPGPREAWVREEPTPADLPSGAAVLAPRLPRLQTELDRAATATGTAVNLLDKTATLTPAILAQLDRVDAELKALPLAALWLEHLISLYDKLAAAPDSDGGLCRRNREFYGRLHDNARWASEVITPISAALGGVKQEKKNG
ncbi:MAG: DUF115 domain-containing protein [Victivallales bacterium]|nr:DUF115 domain-containing protein [Victivallales bacterium]